MLQSIRTMIQNKIQRLMEGHSPISPWDRFTKTGLPETLLRQSLQNLEGGRVFCQTDSNLATISTQHSPDSQMVDWAEEIKQSNLASLQRQSLRQTKDQILSDNTRLNRLSQLLSLALKSGNISLAMMIFSQIEARSANEVTRILMEKVRALQEHKRELSLKIQGQQNDAEGSKNMQKLKTDMEEANDDINVLQNFIREVAQNKQYSLELASGFLTKEHETTMSIVRSFGR